MARRRQATDMGLFTASPIGGAGFGTAVRFREGRRLSEAVAELEDCPQMLLDVFHDAGGLLVLEGLDAIVEDPQLLLRISRFFGDEVENYRETLTPAHMIHEQVPEILLLSNLPPCERRPPPQPEPPRAADGALPVQFPHRRGWHTDQSFRRPPSDVSSFYAVIPAPPGQGQTLFADGVAAFEALPDSTRSRISKLDGVHALLGTGRSEQAVRAGEPVKPLLPHQRSQPQPLVRKHSVRVRADG